MNSANQRPTLPLNQAMAKERAPCPIHKTTTILRMDCPPVSSGALLDCYYSPQYPTMSDTPRLVEKRL